MIIVHLWTYFTYTGPRLLRVRLLRAPSYNKQILLSKMNISHDINVQEVQVQRVTVKTSTFL